LTQRLKQSRHVIDNFRYISSLNLEYFRIDLGDGAKKYTEKDKIELEKVYLEICKRTQIK